MSVILYEIVTLYHVKEQSTQQLPEAYPRAVAVDDCATSRPGTLPARWRQLQSFC